MKTLFILRHAEAAPDNGKGDLQRVLTPRGIEHAKAIGVTMKEKNYVPEFVMCSAAMRTKQTLEGILESISPKKIEHAKTVYHATTEELITIIRNFNDEYESALVVGHNPVMHELTAGLAMDEPSEMLTRLARGYPPGTLSIFKCPRASWKDLHSGENRLINLLS